jgi:hypothetical protein
MPEELRIAVVEHTRVSCLLDNLIQRETDCNNLEEFLLQRAELQSELIPYAKADKA